MNNPDYMSEAQAAAEDAANAYKPPEKPHPIDWQNKLDRLVRLANEVRKNDLAPGNPPTSPSLDEIIAIAEEVKRHLRPPSPEETADAIHKS